MISEIRARQPGEEEMKCGTQSADIRVIHRRSHFPRVALLVGYRAHTSLVLDLFASSREKVAAPLDKDGHIRRFSRQVAESAAGPPICLGVFGCVAGEDAR